MNFWKIIQFGILALCLTACGGGGGGGSGDSGGSSSSSSSSGGSSGTGSSGGSGTDTTPDDVVFLNVENALPETVVTSSPVTITGIDTPILVEVSDGEFSIDGGAFSSDSRTVSNNQTLAVRLISAAELGGEVWADVQIGEFMTTFTVKTRGDLNSPSAHIDYPAKDGVYVFHPELTVSGVANDDSAIGKVTVNGIEGEYDAASKKWKATIPLTEYGSTAINVEVIDVYDNRTEIPGVTVHTTPDYDHLPRKGLAYSSLNGGELLFGSPLKRYVLESNTYIPVEIDGTEAGFTGFVYSEVGDFAIGYGSGSLYRVNDFSGTPEEIQLYSGAGQIIDVAFDADKSNVYFLVRADGTHILKGLALTTNEVSVINDDVEYGIYIDYFTALEYVDGSVVLAGRTNSSSDSGGAFFSVDIATGAVTKLVSFANHADYPLSSIREFLYRPADNSFIFVGSPYYVSGITRTSYNEGEIYRWDASSDNLVKLVDVNALEAFNLNLSSPHLVEKGNTGNLLLTTDDSGEIFEVNMMAPASVSQLTQPLRGTGAQLVMISSLEPLVYSAGDQQLYMTTSSAQRSDNAGKVVAVDSESGDRRVISGPDRGTGQAFNYIYDLQLGGTGTLYALDGNRGAFSLLRIDIASGNRTLVSDNSTTDGLVLNNAFEMEADLEHSRAWVLSEKGRITSVSLATGEKADLENGSGQPIGEGAWVDIDSMVITSGGQYLYLLGYQAWGQPYSVFKVDVEAGAIVMTANFSDPSKLGAGCGEMLLSGDENTLIFAGCGGGLHSIAADFSTPLKDIPLNGAQFLAGVALDYESEFLFGLDSWTNSVLEINPASNAAVAISH